MAVAEAASVEVVHAVPGRVRLRVPLLKRYPGLEQRLATRGTGQPGLRRIRVNPTCASVVCDADSPELAEQRVRTLVNDWLEVTRRRGRPPDDAECKPDTPSAALVPSRSRFAALGASLVGLGLTFLGPGLPQTLAASVTLLTALPTAWRAARALALERRASGEQLDAAAIGLMLVSGDVRGAAISRVVVAVAEHARDLTARRSRCVSLDLRGTLGPWAWLVRDGQEILVPIDQLALGDLVSVYARAPIPVDGVVEAGTARVNQRALTGEGRPLDKTVGDRVYAATLLTEGWLHIRASAVGPETRAGWVVETLERLPERDTRATDYASNFEDRLVAPIFGLAGLAGAIGRNPERAAAVLNVDYGTGLEISVPTSTLACMAHAAQDGILIKSGAALERLARADAIVLDKTGTLTRGRPEVTEVVSLTGEPSGTEVLALAAAVEANLRHVVARAILRQARRRGLELPPAHDVQHVARLGVIARVDGREVRVGNVRFLAESGLERDDATLAHATRLGTSGNAVVYVVVDGQIAGLIAYQDMPRRESAAVVRWLRTHGLPTIHLVTGDGPWATYPSAQATGIADGDVHTDALPEEKARVVETLQRQGHLVAFVGDGIDDAPALAMADVSVSFRHGAEVAQEMADVVLLDHDLQGLVHAIELARAGLGIVRQNNAFVYVADAVVAALAATGRFDPATSALISTAGTAVVAANSLRPLLAPRRVGHHHQAQRRAVAPLATQAATAARAEERKVWLPQHA
jgi:Cu2+-exporting ATPase